MTSIDKRVGPSRTEGWHCPGVEGTYAHHRKLAVAIAAVLPDPMITREQQIDRIITVLAAEGVADPEVHKTALCDYINLERHLDAVRGQLAALRSKADPGEVYSQRTIDAIQASHKQQLAALQAENKDDACMIGDLTERLRVAEQQLAALRTGDSDGT